MQGFENKEQEKEVWRALHQHIMPSKFAYVGEAANTRDILAYQSSSREVTLAVNLEMTAVRNFFQDNTNAAQQVCDVGPGNGKHTAAFLRAYRDAGYQVDKYLGLDFSKTFLTIGSRLIKEQLAGLKVADVVWDFEQAPTKAVSQWRSAGSVLITLTGHTLGNPTNPIQVLQHLHDSCIADDILVAGVALMNSHNPDSILQAYNTDVFRAAVLEPLRMVGFNIKDGDFNLRFSLPQKTVVAEFILRKDMQLDYTGEHLKFNKGDAIQCFRSSRFTDDEIKSILNESGWKISTEACNKERAWAVFVSKRS